MKRILVLIVAVGLVFGASAQGHRGGVVKRGAPRVTYVIPRVPAIGYYAPLYPSYGWGYAPAFGYNPFFGSSMYRPSRPSKLDLQIEDIRNDYGDRIKSARRDDALTRKERRAVIQKLRHDRTAAIIDAKRDYYKTYSRSQG